MLVLGLNIPLFRLSWILQTRLKLRPFPNP